MSVRKHGNSFLDANDNNDDESQGYVSEEEFEKGGRSAKRRRVEDDSDAEEVSDEEQDFDKGKAQPDRSSDGSVEDEQNGDQNDADHGAEDEEAKSTRHKESPDTPRLVKPLSKKNLVSTEKAIKKSGVVYLSRVPPYMRPTKLRSLLSAYGEINRIFLAPEDPQAHARRVRAGGNKRKLFTEGWIEFVDRKAAKRACDLLNARPIGGKKGNFYHDDIWNLRYLHSFKWRDLTKQIDTENAERASRIRAEIGKTTRENKDFVRNVEKGKMLENIQAKAAAKRKKGSGDLDGDGEHVGGQDDAGAPERKRLFKQTPLVKRRQAEETDSQPEQVKRVLSKIF